MPPAREPMTEEHVAFLDVYNAAKRDDPKALRGLIDGGANLDVAYSNGNTPLIWAARMGHKQAVKLLLEHGADINARNAFGCTALHEAAEHGRADEVRLLVEHGVERGVQATRSDGTGGNTPLMLAARNGQVGAAAALVEQRSEEPLDLEQRDSEGNTALMWAILCGQIKVVRLLQAKKASVENVDKKGVSVFGMAARMGQEVILKALLEEVVSPTSTLPLGAAPPNPEQLAAAQEENLAKANKLLGMTDENGNTALMWAVRAAGAMPTSKRPTMPGTPPESRSRGGKKDGKKGAQAAAHPPRKCSWLPRHPPARFACLRLRLLTCGTPLRTAGGPSNAVRSRPPSLALPTPLAISIRC